MANVVKSVLFSNLRTFKDVQFGVSAFVTEEKNVVPGFPSDFKVQEYYINRALYFKAEFNFIEIYQVNQIYDFFLIKNYNIKISYMMNFLHNKKILESKNIERFKGRKESRNIKKRPLPRKTKKS